MSSQDFMEQLRQQTQEDEKVLQELKAQQEQIKLQIKFLEKRIASSNDMLNISG